MIPTKLAYEERYSDDSGVQYGVRYHEQDGMELEDEGEIMSFPVARLDWYIEALIQVRDEIRNDKPIRSMCIWSSTHNNVEEE